MHRQHAGAASEFNRCTPRAFANNRSSARRLPGWSGIGKSSFGPRPGVRMHWAERNPSAPEHMPAEPHVSLPPSPTGIPLLLRSTLPLRGMQVATRMVCNGVRFRFREKSARTRRGVI